MVKNTQASIGDENELLDLSEYLIWLDFHPIERIFHDIAINVHNDDADTMPEKSNHPTSIQRDSRIMKAGCIGS